MQHIEYEILFYKEKIDEQFRKSLGYPFCKDSDFTSLYSLFSYPIVNVGDPFTESNYRANSFGMERDIIKFFGELFGAPNGEYTGYITSGGSEGNLYGLYLARELHPNGVVYHSMESHYSILKNIRLLGLESVCIAADRYGEMNYHDLELHLKYHGDRPIIILANIGTTMTEAKDDIAKIKRLLLKYNMSNHYIHCDAALSGVYLPLLETDGPLNFRSGIDSIACSGHKFMGAPMPCGVVVVKKSNRNKILNYVSYIDSVDSTITGSRNGHNPVFLWYAINKLGLAGLKKRANDSIAIAEYTLQRFNSLGINAFRNKNAITVVFEKPNEMICRKWQLAVKGDIAHIVCMPGVTTLLIDEFFIEVMEERFPV